MECNEVGNMGIEPNHSGPLAIVRSCLEFFYAKQWEATERFETGV